MGVCSPSRGERPASTGLRSLGTSPPDPGGLCQLRPLMRRHAHLGRRALTWIGLPRSDGLRLGPDDLHLPGPVRADAERAPSVGTNFAHPMAGAQVDWTAAGRRKHRVAETSSALIPTPAPGVAVVRVTCQDGPGSRPGLGSSCLRAAGVSLGGTWRCPAADGEAPGAPLLPRPTDAGR
jgi:hypothetical protein